ncbi:hypothetical protein [Roseovarius sp.]|uniref:hypothetical protein n=1 Tax=Roseovarius sp. TaxID=1486281 RepID=UPI003D0C809F
MAKNIVEEFQKRLEGKTLREASDEEMLAFVMTQRSFNYEKLTHLLESSEDWSAIIVAHIHADHVVRCLLDQMLRNLDETKAERGRISFLDKLAFCFGLGAVSPASFSSLKRLNAERNKFAHRLNFVVSDELKGDLLAHSIREYSTRLEERKEFKEADNGEIDFKTLLLLMVIFLEEERLAHSLQVLKSARGEADLKDALAEASRVLNS